MVEMLIVGGVVGALALVGGAWWLYERRRREAMRQAAMEMGFTFDESGEQALGLIPCRRHLLSLGRSPGATNLLAGTIGDVEVLLFDYAYTTGSGKSASRHRQTVAAYRVPGAHLPEFDLRPENVFHKIGSVLGYRDIDLPDHAEFSARALIRGEDEGSVRALFDQEVVDAVKSAPKISIEAAGEWVLVYRAGKRASADEIPALLESGFTLATLIAARGTMPAG